MRHLYNSVCTTNNERNTAIFAEMAAGGMGFDVINDTDEHIGNYYTLIPLTTTRVLSAGYWRSTEVGGYSGGDLSTVDIPVGINVNADFTSVQLVSGAVLAYFMLTPPTLPNPTPTPEPTPEPTPTPTPEPTPDPTPPPPPPTPTPIPPPPTPTPPPPPPTPTPTPFPTPEPEPTPEP